MDPWFPGVIHTVVATALQFKINLKNVQQIQATGWAFAAILADGSVVAWGLPAYGGDSSAVQDQLKNVQQIQATRGAFAAIFSRWIRGCLG